jgi:vancomycin resistance protein YoaR
MYWIPRYGQPPSGMKGLDATVDAPYVDFKFKNNTGNWLAIQSSTDNANVYFSVYGTKTGWQVKVEGPIITNVVPAQPEMVYQEDPTMPWGKELFVEHAENGFTATVVRTVTKDGEVVDKYTSVSRYRPSRNVTLVGIKGRPEPKEEEQLDASIASPEKQEPE